MNINYKIFLVEPNGNYAELDLDTSAVDFTTTFSVSNISDISQRKDRLSKNLVLKGTKNNNRILGNCFNFSRYADGSLDEKMFYNYSPNRAVDCVVFENSTMLFKGGFKLQEIDKDKNGNYTYQAIITGYFINFLGKIGDALLTSAFTGSDSHTFNMNTVINSWIYNTGQTFIYPSIDFGSGIVPNAYNFDIGNFRTGVYLKTYFDNIFNTYGYSYSGDFINSDLFKKAYIPYTEESFSKNVQSVIYSAQTTSGYTWYFTEGNYEALYSIEMDSAVSTDTITVSGQNNEFIFKKDVKTQITSTVNCDIAFSIQPSDPTYNVDIFLNHQYYNLTGADLTGITVTANYTMPYSAYTGNTAFGIPLDIYYSQRDIDASNIAPIALTVHYADIIVGATGLTSTIAIKSGDTVSLKDVIPQDITIKDFLKSTLQFYNLYMIEDPNNPNGLIIEPYDIFYNRCQNPVKYALDWTHKLDLSKGYKMTISTDLPSAYQFKFTDDSDYYNDLYKQKYNDTYGNFTISNSAFTGNDAKDIQVSFSPTVIVLENYDDKTMAAIWKGDLTKKESFKSNMRLLYNNGTGSCQSYNVSSVNVDSGGTVTGHTVLYTGLTYYNTSDTILKSGTTNVFNALFGVPKEVYATVGQDIFSLPNIYSYFYQNQLIELNDLNLFILEASFNLNSIDMGSLDFRTPIFIQSQDGMAYFKLNKIDYYNSNVLADVKLQKVII